MNIDVAPTTELLVDCLPKLICAACSIGSLQELWLASLGIHPGHKIMRPPVRPKKPQQEQRVLPLLFPRASLAWLPPKLQVQDRNRPWLVGAQRCVIRVSMNGLATAIQQAKLRDAFASFRRRFVAGLALCVSVGVYELLPVHTPWAQCCASRAAREKEVEREIVEWDWAELVIRGSDSRLSIERGPIRQAHPRLPCLKPNKHACGEADKHLRNIAMHKVVATHVHLLSQQIGQHLWEAFVHTSIGARN